MASGYHDRQQLKPPVVPEGVSFFEGMRGSVAISHTAAAAVVLKEKRELVLFLLYQNRRTAFSLLPKGNYVSITDPALSPPCVLHAELRVGETQVTKLLQECASHNGKVGKAGLKTLKLVQDMINTKLSGLTIDIPGGETNAPVDSVLIMLADNALDSSVGQRAPPSRGAASTDGSSSSDDMPTLGAGLFDDDECLPEIDDELPESTTSSAAATSGSGRLDDLSSANSFSSFRIVVSNGVVEHFKISCVRQRKVLEIIDAIINVIFEDRKSPADLLRKANYIQLFKLFEKVKAHWRQSTIFTAVQLDQLLNDHDAFGELYVQMFGAAAVTNYVQDIISGTMHYFAKEYGNLYWWSNISFEGFMGTVRSNVHRRSQNGGHSGTATGGRASIVKHLYLFALRKFCRSIDDISGTHKLEKAVAKSGHETNRGDRKEKRKFRDSEEDKKQKKRRLVGRIDKIVKTVAALPPPPQIGGQVPESRKLSAKRAKLEQTLAALRNNNMEEEENNENDDPQVVQAHDETVLQQDAQLDATPFF